MATDISDLRKDEHEAIDGYNDFIKNYGHQITKKDILKIKGIIRDEKRHIKILSEMKRGLTPQ